MKKTILITLGFIVLCVGIALAGPIRSMLASRGGEYADYEEEPPYPLPDGVVAVEYLESDGNSYILTGYTTSRNLLSFAYDVTFSYKDATASSGTVVFQSQNSSQYCNSGIEIVTGSKNWMRCYSHGGVYGTAYVNSFKRKIRVCCDVDGTYDIDNGAFVGKITPIDAWSYPSKIGLFCFSFSSITPSKPGVRIYEASLSYPDVFEFHFIPVRFLNEDGIWEGAMWDLVSEELFRNQGTGSFIIGPDL